MAHFGDTYFHRLSPTSVIDLPQQFTFPFYYKPHLLSVLAVKDLQNYLEYQTDFKHNFGLNDNSYTSKRRPVELIFSQAFMQFEQAEKFEKKIKRNERLFNFFRFHFNSRIEEENELFDQKYLDRELY